MRAAKHLCSALLLMLLPALAPGPMAEDRRGVFYDLSYRLYLNPGGGDRIIAEFKASSGEELLRCLTALEALGRSGPQPWIERCDRNPSPEARARCKSENLDSWGNWIATMLAVVRGEKKWQETDVARDMAITQWAIVGIFGQSAHDTMVRQKLETAKPLYACD